LIDTAKFILLEEKFRETGARLIAGVDEVGRGAFAGPVAAAAVILSRDSQISGLKDSKKLSAKKRDFLCEKIMEIAICYSCEFVSNEIIDEVGIKMATHLAMEKSIQTLIKQPDFLIVDGNDNISFEIAYEYIVKGDQKYTPISAASIIAKVTRDAFMVNLSKQYPQYGWHKNKGYGTEEHRAAIKKFGLCKLHRKTFIH
jgi:ribonuclease HII